MSNSKTMRVPRKLLSLMATSLMVENLDLISPPQQAALAVIEVAEADSAAALVVVAEEAASVIEAVEEASATEEEVDSVEEAVTEEAVAEVAEEAESHSNTSLSDSEALSLNSLINDDCIFLIFSTLFFPFILTTYSKY